MVAGHVVAAWGLLQMREVRDTVALMVPVFVEWVAPPAPPAPAEPAPPEPPPRVPPPRPLPRVVAPPPVPVIAAPPAAAVAPFVAPPAEEPPPPVQSVPDAVPAPPALPAPPKEIPASAVQYLVAPTLDYPAASRRAGEAGRVLVRVFIDEAGLPSRVHLRRSSGFARLDDAALTAVQRARFRPYTENGVPTGGWALIPLTFDLER